MVSSRVKQWLIFSEYAVLSSLRLETSISLLKKENTTFWINFHFSGRGFLFESLPSWRFHPLIYSRNKGGSGLVW